MRRLVFTLFALAACDGRHTLGIDNDPLSSKCCAITTSCEKVDSCQNRSDCFCAPELCQKGAQCQASSDCATIAAPCAQCADGSTTCPKAECVNGQCVAKWEPCPSDNKCTTEQDCKNVAIPEICKPCPDGSCAGYSVKCIQGQCVASQDACTTECAPVPGVCPAIGCAILCTPLKKDANGCDICECASGCGGITGGTCKAGETCVDDPSDSCDPNNGGADCSGHCNVTPKPTPGQCVAPQSCLTCPDGTFSCATADCVNGVCKVTYPACAPAPAACATLSECECFKRSDCSASTEACHCPSVCDPNIVCICGGGKFLSCKNK